MESLPEECISAILSLTSPADACCMSSTSKTLRSAAGSDTVWLSFLPSDYQNIISRSDRSDHLNSIVTKKDLYLDLCDSPVLIDDGEKSFSLDKRSGKKCYMISSSSLYIAWVDTPSDWEHTSLPESRFARVAQLRGICWLEIRGHINIKMLSPATKYAVYLVYKLTPRALGFTRQLVDVTVQTIVAKKRYRTVYLEPNGSLSQSRDYQNYPKMRNDGWLEIKMGEYFNEGGMDQNLDMSLEEVRTGLWKTGLVVEGIEMRPKA